MWLQAVVGCVIALLAMLITFGLVRVMADLVIVMVLLTGFGLVIYNIINEVWVDWVEISLGALATGVAVALLSLPALPFSSFYKKK